MLKYLIHYLLVDYSNRKRRLGLEIYDFFLQTLAVKLSLQSDGIFSPCLNIDNSSNLNFQGLNH